jgi:hypothetical protein
VRKPRVCHVSLGNFKSPPSSDGCRVTSLTNIRTLKKKFLFIPVQSRCSLKQRQPLATSYVAHLPCNEFESYLGYVNSKTNRRDAGETALLMWTQIVYKSSLCLTQGFDFLWHVGLHTGSAGN